MGWVIQIIVAYHWNCGVCGASGFNMLAWYLRDEERCIEGEVWCSDCVPKDVRYNGKSYKTGWG